MDFHWTARRNAEKKRLAQIASCLKANNVDKDVLAAAKKAALLVDTKHRSIEVEFNKIVTRAHKKAYLARFKSPTHTLAGKYTPTAMALLDFLLGSKIPLDRWIFAQADFLTIPHFNLFHCYGEPALKRYTAWEAKQVKKFPSLKNRIQQTDSAQEIIRLSIMDGHIAALSWVEQLKKINPPSVSAGLFYMLPYLQGWYVLSYASFREDVMETGLCDQKHMLLLWNKYKRSRIIQELCQTELERAEQKLGKLAWV